MLIPEADELDFYEAQGTCESFGGTLFEPLDQATNDLLALKASASGLFENSIWIGIVRDLDEVTYFGQSSKTEPTFQPWHLSHPKNYVMHVNYVHLVTSVTCFLISLENFNRQTQKVQKNEKKT